MDDVKSAGIRNQGGENCRGKAIALYDIHDNIDIDFSI